MKKTINNPKFVLRKEVIRTLALAELVIVAGGDLTTVSRESNLLSNVPTDVNPSNTCAIG